MSIKKTWPFAFLLCHVLFPELSYADFGQTFSQTTGVTTNAGNIASNDANLQSFKAKQQTMHTQVQANLAKVDVTLALESASLNKLLLAIIGVSPIAVIHDDIQKLTVTINQATAIAAKQAALMYDAAAIKEEQKLTSITENMDIPSNKEADCQAALMGDAVAASSSQANKTIKKVSDAASSMLQTRAKTMRNQSEDKTVSVEEHASKFCSQTDADAGLCKAADVCTDGDLSCKAGADQSASLFMRDHYDNIAHEEGAMLFIKNITDPYPSGTKPKASLENEDLNFDKYRYDQMVKASRGSVSTALMVGLWSDRMNIYEGDAQQPITKLIDNISSYDPQTSAKAEAMKNKEYAPASYKTFAELMAESNPAYNGSAAKSVAAKPSVKGVVSRIDLYDLQLGSMYGNTDWETKLSLGDGEYRRNMGRVIALQNRFLLDLVKKMDTLILSEAVILAGKGGKK